MVGVALVLTTTTLLSFHGAHGRPNNADSPTTVSPFEDVTTVGSILDEEEEASSDMEDTTTAASGMIVDNAQHFPPP